MKRYVYVVHHHRGDRVHRSMKNDLLKPKETLKEEENSTRVSNYRESVLYCTFDFIRRCRKILIVLIVLK